MVMVFNATFNNISDKSWRSVWLMEETGENHRPSSSHWQTLSHNVVSSIQIMYLCKPVDILSVCVLVYTIIMNMVDWLFLNAKWENNQLRSNLLMWSHLLSIHPYWKVTFFLFCHRTFPMNWISFMRSPVLKGHFFIVPNVTS